MEHGSPQLLSLGGGVTADDEEAPKAIEMAHPTEPPQTEEQTGPRFRRTVVNAGGRPEKAQLPATQDVVRVADSDGDEEAGNSPWPGNVKTTIFEISVLLVLLLLFIKGHLYWGHPKDPSLARPFEEVFDVTAEWADGLIKATIPSSDLFIRAALQDAANIVKVRQQSGDLEELRSRLWVCASAASEVQDSLGSLRTIININLKSVLERSQRLRLGTLEEARDALAQYARRTGESDVSEVLKAVVKARGDLAELSRQLAEIGRRCSELPQGRHGLYEWVVTVLGVDAGQNDDLRDRLSVLEGVEKRVKQGADQVALIEAQQKKALEELRRLSKGTLRLHNTSLDSCTKRLQELIESLESSSFDKYDQVLQLQERPEVDEAEVAKSVR